MKKTEESKVNHKGRKGAAISNMLIKLGLFEKAKLEQELKGGKGVTQVHIPQKDASSLCKSPYAAGL